MEEDRAAADLGPEVSTELVGDEVVEEKAPRRRFIGRRAAEAKAASTGDTDGKATSNGAVQGADDRDDASE